MSIVVMKVRADIEELKGLMEHSKRPRVLDFLVIETRRLETKLGELLKKQVYFLPSIPLSSIIHKNVIHAMV